jgi:hypothetical protein
MGVKLGSLTLRGGHRPGTFEKRMLRIFGLVVLAKYYEND